MMGFSSAPRLSDVLGHPGLGRALRATASVPDEHAERAYVDAAPAEDRLRRDAVDRIQHGHTASPRVLKKKKKLTISKKETKA